MKKTPNKTFWVTNMSNRNVSLTDLALTIKAFSSVNLLDEKHYYYTPEQLEKSALNGSLWEKKRMLKVRKSPPPDTKEAGISISKETFIPGRERSTLNIKEEVYEELRVETEERHAEEEKFAEENAELADLDAKPQIINKR
jgi:hypothetical protein